MNVSSKRYVLFSLSVIAGYISCDFAWEVVEGGPSEVVQFDKVDLSAEGRFFPSAIKTANVPLAIPVPNKGWDKVAGGPSEAVQLNEVDLSGNDEHFSPIGSVTEVTVSQSGWLEKLGQVVRKTAQKLNFRKCCPRRKVCGEVPEGFIVETPDREELVKFASTGLKTLSEEIALSFPRVVKEAFPPVVSTAFEWANNTLLQRAACPLAFIGRCYNKCEKGVTGFLSRQEAKFKEMCFGPNVEMEFLISNSGIEDQSEKNALRSCLRLGDKLPSRLGITKYFTVTGNVVSSLKGCLGLDCSSVCYMKHVFSLSAGVETVGSLSNENLIELHDTSVKAVGFIKLAKRFGAPKFIKSGLGTCCGYAYDTASSSCEYVADACRSSCEYLSNKLRR